MPLALNELNDLLPGHAKWENLDEKHILVTCWNWDYLAALNFQERCVEFIQENSAFRFTLFCNHPPCFTMGRGVRSHQFLTSETLKERKKIEMAHLSWPVFPIHRGGGLTFHHPEQWIIYPLVKLNPRTMTFTNHLDALLQQVKSCLERAFNLQVQEKLNPLGLWIGPYKVASVGVGIKHFITMHGLALNLKLPETYIKEISKTNPCGLDSANYRSVEDFLSEKGRIDLLASFHSTFLQKLFQVKENNS